MSSRRRGKQPSTHRVLVLNHYALPLTQGGGTRHIELFSLLDPLQWDFTIMASDRVPQTRQRFNTADTRFQLISIPAYDDSNGRQRIAGWVIFAIRAFLAGLRHPKPDIVYASTPHLLTPVAGWLLARVRRARFVLEVRDLWPESLVEFDYIRRDSAVHRILRWLEHRLYNAADHIVIVTPGWRDYLVERGVSPDAITAVSNGSDPEVFAPRETGKSLQTLLGVDGPIVIYAGAHGPPNGLDAVLDAAARLPAVTFALFGSGAMKSELVDRAHREHLTNMIFRDSVPKSELAEFLWTADIGLHTLADMELFRTGMSPNKLYDYMAAKLPLVSNAEGDARRIIEEARCGAAATPQGIVDAIETVLSASLSDRIAMGENGHDWLIAHASRQAVVKDLERGLATALRTTGRTR